MSHMFIKRPHKLNLHLNLNLFRTLMHMCLDT